MTDNTRAELAKPATPVEPFAYTTGVYAGRFTVEPVNSATVIPSGVALYLHPTSTAWHDVPMPTPDGSSEANKVPHPAGGYEYDEIDAWSEPLVRAYASACVAADRTALKAERDELLAAAKGLDEAYCRAGWHLSAKERHEDRMRLIAIRAAIAKAEGK